MCLPSLLCQLSYHYWLYQPLGRDPHGLRIFPAKTLVGTNIKGCRGSCIIGQIVCVHSCRGTGLGSVAFYVTRCSCKLSYRCSLVLHKFILKLSLLWFVYYWRRRDWCLVVSSMYLCILRCCFMEFEIMLLVQYVLLTILNYDFSLAAFICFM